MHIDLAQHDHLVALRASGSSPQATGQLVWTRVPPTGHWLLGLILPVGRVQARGRGLADRARHVGVWSLVESPFPVTSRSALNSTVSLAFILSSSHSLSLALPVTTSFKPHINISASLVDDSRPPHHQHTLSRKMAPLALPDMAALFPSDKPVFEKDSCDVVFVLGGPGAGYGTLS